MQVDISFEFAKVYNIEKADVVKGQKFSLLSDFDNGKWFSDNDEVLSLKVKGKNAELTADEIGLTTILIMSSTFAIEKTLTINVVLAIPNEEEMASNLNATSGEAIPK